MAHLPKIGFKPFSKVESGTVVIPVGAKLELGKFAGGVASDAGLGKAAAAANFTGSSGVLNIFDIQAYIGLYNAHDPAADLAAPSGTFNIFDIQAYIALYNKGCP